MGKFKIKEIEKYLEENKLSEINQTMLIILCKMINEYLTTLEKEGILIKFKSREGDDRAKKNTIVDNIIPTFSMISKILKDNNLVVPKKAMEEEADEFQNLMSKLIDNQ